jgi:predicted outer membrane repeat protein
MVKLLTRAALLLSFVFHAHAALAVTVPTASYPTIQSAINAVVSGALPNGTFIDVQPGTYTEFLTVNATSKSMTVRGVAGPASTVVRSPSTGSILKVLSATGAVRFEGLTLRNGTGVPGQGGALTLLDSSPTFFNCVFLSNTASPSGGAGVLSRSNAVFDTTVFQGNTATSHGGAIVAVNGSRPLFVNSQFIGNVSGTTDPTGSGGAVHLNDASATFRSTTFSSNQSNFAGGAILVIGVFGSPYGTATLVLEDCTVSNNRSVQAPGQNPSEGGGVHIEDNTAAYVTRTRIASNTAHTGGGLSTYRARYEIFHSIIEGNSATGAPNGGGFGGGIDATSNNVIGPLRPGSAVILHDTAVRNNTAIVGGGILIGGDHVCGGGACPASTATKATLMMTETLFDNNRASQQGGGIAADLSVVTIDQSHILRNASSGFGGGLFIMGSTNATITNSTIASNTTPANGGGIFLDTGAVLNVNGSRIYKNTAAVNAGGGIYVNGAASPSGIVSASVIADNSSFQIAEQNCPPAGIQILTYNNNTITPSAGQNDFYSGTCSGQVTSITAFEAMPKTSGNITATPTFASFMATPGVGPTSVLSWAAARAATVTTNGVFATGPVGATDVSPTVRTMYTMTSSPATATLSAVVTAIIEWGLPTDVPVPGDYDADGKNDIAVYRPSTGQWFIVLSSGGSVGKEWGVASAGDEPVPADYDGDGKTDIAVYRQTTGEWFIVGSTAGVMAFKWGEPSLGDIPVPGDYDGDGKANVAIYRPSNGQWFIRLPTGGYIARNWGVPAAGDQPVPADYDGDGKTDFAVYRTSNGLWFVLPASGAASLSFNWGVPSLGDIPVPADYDGDSKADVAVMRTTTGQWFVLKSSGGTQVSNWGAGAARVPGDYDFNRADDVAVWTPTARWVVKR